MLWTLFACKCSRTTSSIHSVFSAVAAGSTAIRKLSSVTTSSMALLSMFSALLLANRCSADDKMLVLKQLGVDLYELPGQRGLLRAMCEICGASNPVP